MPIVYRKSRQALYLFLGFVGLSMFAASCSSDSCDEGEYRLDGECVPISTE